MNLQFNDPNAVFIVKKLREHHFEAFFVGGCVRDSLLGQKVSDIDITTSAHPHEVQKIFHHTLEVGANFGVIIVVLKGCNYEVATFRSDGAYLDGRRPSSVTFSTAQEDVKRRDFTINGLLYDPIQHKLIDYVEGQKDLQAKQIRAIGDPLQRFTEDKLRMLRAIRFTVRLNFTLEEQTQNAIKKMAPQITCVSRERITEEFEKVFSYPNPEKAILLMQETGLLEQILPHFRLYSPQSFQTIIALLQNTPSLDFTTACSILLAYETTKAEIKNFQFPDYTTTRESEQQLRKSALFVLSNQQIKQISAIWSCLTQFPEKNSLRLATQRRIMLNPFFSEALRLQQSAEKCIHRTPMAAMWQNDFQKLIHTVIPISLLNGNELSTLGIPTGPKLAQAKQMLEDLQLEDIITTKEQAAEFIKEHFLK